jgi:hypothetical protein
MAIACRIAKVPSGDLLVTPDTARELANAGIIHPIDTGNYELVFGKDDALWAFLRQRSW